MNQKNPPPSYRNFSALSVFRTVCVLLGSLLLTAGACAAPLLRCEVTYAGTLYIVETAPTNDPYSIAAVDIGERFRFKAVMIGIDKPVDYIKLYAYFQTRHKDMPIHQATYLPPFTVSDKPTLLTPQNYLYAGDVERELQYQCTLQGVPP
ncbi:hypothetical protein [Undibacterium sp.]|jgi:hypothetical protein|uniref:hypothetical protein n=1 Tax=Undibacterium sp. TaxID=1914977 RepID=UPI002C20A0E0|nr:hypothetical protein [Undibacterium sp.]HTD03145.1 hypothetical protein [Undibacterium sp.]